MLKSMQQRELLGLRPTHSPWWRRGGL